MLDLLKRSILPCLQVHDPEDDSSPGSIFNKEDFNSEREFTSINGRKFDVLILFSSLAIEGLDAKTYSHTPLVAMPG